jgi:RNA polymerase sigma-70 factor (sigma-E family)
MSREVPVEAPEGYAEFVRDQAPSLARAAFLLTGDRYLAEDLLQVALAKAALRWRGIESNPAAYVRRILYTERVGWWRRRRVAETLSGEVPQAAAVYDPDAVERRLLLRQALARLTAGQRAVLILRFYEDLTERATAEVLGVAVGTVKSQTRHALARLRALAPELADLVPNGLEGHGDG